jgi:hypothetical protein
MPGFAAGHSFFLREEHGFLFLLTTAKRREGILLTGIPVLRVDCLVSFFAGVCYFSLPGFSPTGTFTG